MVNVSAIDFVESFDKSDEVVNLKPLAYEHWLRVVERSTRHTEFQDENALYATSRPNEEKIFTDWRESNRRYISRGPINKFQSMLTRILQYSNMSLTKMQIDEVLLDHLKTKPFDFLGRRADFDEFRYSFLIPASLNDPNGVIVDIPYLVNNVETVPAKASGDNQEISTHSYFIPSSRIVEREDLLMWYHDDIEIVKGKDKKLERYYFVIDHEAYYRYLPRYDSEGNLEYYLEPYYTHNCGHILYAELPARQVTHTQNNFRDIIKYKVSYIDTAFSYLDEMVIQLSSDQVNRVRHMYPKMWVNGAIDCKKCNGTKTVPLRDGMGNPMIENGKIKNVKCPDCNGTGTAHDLGDFGTMVIGKTPSHINDKAMQVPVGYVTPPVQNLQFGYDTWKDLLLMAERELFIDPTEGTPNESSLARAQRLEPKQDLIKSYADDFNRMSEDILNNKECLLVVSDKKRRLIHFPRPLSYEVKNPEMLRVEALESSPLERKEKFLKYIKTEHRGDEKAIKAHELALMYAPLIMYDKEEIILGINSGAYDVNDIIKRDYALDAFKDILSSEKEGAQRRKSLKEYFEEADKWLQDLGLIKPDFEPSAPPIPGEGDE